MELALLTIAATLVVLVAGPLAAFARTSHGPNAYTVKGAVNVLTYAGYWQRCAQLINAQITSAWRNETVNAAVGGVPTSDHLAGLACDFAPYADYWTAIAKARAACEAGQLGPVRQFIAESYKNCLHLGMYPAGTTGPTQYLHQTDAETFVSLTRA